MWRVSWYAHAEFRPRWIRCDQSRRTLSPCLSHCGGRIARPTPPGVPVKMMSPGPSTHRMRTIGVRTKMEHSDNDHADDPEVDQGERPRRLVILIYTSARAKP